MEHNNWTGFKGGVWQNEINLRDFIQQNYKEYTGDDSFLAGATERTNDMMKKVNSLFKLERQYGGVLDIDTTTVSSLTAYAPGYIDKENELIGVMQLINAQKDDEIIPFSNDVEYVITSLASQCSILLSNMLLLENVRKLLDSFVNAMTTAIESRTPYNANHTKNVSKLCKGFIEYLIENNLYNLTENDKEQLVMAAMLHDVGKMIVPLSVMNKSTRLDGKLELMKSRWNIIRLDLENKYLKKDITFEDYNSKLEEFNSACEFIEMIDTVPFLDTNKLDIIHEIIKLEYKTTYGTLKVVEANEEQDVLIVKGTLTSDERKEIEKHAVYTKEILKEIEFGKRLSASGTTCSFGDLINYMLENTKECLINVIITDAGFSNTTDDIVSLLKEVDGLIVFITNQESHEIKKLSNMPQFKSKLVYILADHNFTI